MNSGELAPVLTGPAGTPYLTADSGKPGVLRLFCFHHAGGAASVFSSWRRHLAPEVTVLPVQLPGRERRIRKPRFIAMAELTQDLARQLDPYLNGPYAFYGHSMGGLVTWNLARQRAGAGRRLPVAFLVPLHAFAGTADTVIDADDMAGWCRYGSPGQVHTVPGGHLFFRGSPDPFLEQLRSVLTR